MPGVLEAFVTKFDFQGLTVSAALRLVFAALAPPNSNQVVYTILEASGWEYAHQNQHAANWIQFRVNAEDGPMGTVSRWRKRYSARSAESGDYDTEFLNVST